MSTYEAATIEEIWQKKNELRGKRDALFLRIYPITLESPRARTFLEQGVLRRISIIQAIIDNIFDMLPPETSEIPSKEKIDLVSALLQSHIINTYGLLDCWAHVWVSEFQITNRKGNPLRDSRIGLSPSYSDVWNSLTDGLRDYLLGLTEWTTRISSIRHSLAHRIPPYIPPYMVDPKNEAEYKKVRSAWFNTLDQKKRDKLDQTATDLAHFKAFLVYDLDEGPPVAFHTQLVADFLTIEEISYKFIAEIPKNSEMLQKH